VFAGQLGDSKFYVSKDLSNKYRKLFSAARENGPQALALLALAQSTTPMEWSATLGSSLNHVIHFWPTTGFA
jgi:hypothetical protein